MDIFTRGIKPTKYDVIRKHLKVNISNESYDYIFDTSAYVKEDVQKLIATLNKENLKRYVFCSSGSVYIPSAEIVTEEFTRGENSNCRSYGLDKKKAENYLFGLWKDEKFPITLFKPTYIYGENNNLYKEAYLFDKVTKGLDIPIPNGNEETQFVYISDLVKVFENTMHTDQTIGQAYNVTHSERVTWQQLVETTMKVVNIIKVNSEKVNISVREYFPFRNITYLLDTRINKIHLVLEI